MMDWTDRHCRFFHRLLTKRTLLYTEMITAQAIRYGDRTRLLGFDPRESPVALQLGGSEPGLLAEAAQWGREFGYSEINLNVGCPSDRVQVGRFGACLMAEPALVADCVAAMMAAVALPVTVKCRIGIDEQHEEEALEDFVGAVAETGCRTFIVHARKAWLKGLSPKENREIPPLNYERVYRLKARHPELEIVINGGIGSLEEAVSHLARVDGVMLGRAAYQRPWIFSAADQILFGDAPSRLSRRMAAEAMADYAAEEIERGSHLSSITRHMLGLYNGQPNGRLWRRILAERAYKPGAGAETLRVAIDAVEPGEFDLIAAE
jgi:tRNA-dihydrouridine synthase A